MARRVLIDADPRHLVIRQSRSTKRGSRGRASTHGERNRGSNHRRVVSGPVRDARRRGDHYRVGWPQLAARRPRARRGRDDNGRHGRGAGALVRTGWPGATLAAAPQPLTPAIGSSAPRRSSSDRRRRRHAAAWSSPSIPGVQVPPAACRSSRSPSVMPAPSTARSGTASQSPVTPKCNPPS